MNLLGFHISRIAPSKRSGEPPAGQPLSAAAAAWLSGRDLDDPGAVMANAYEQVVWVYRAINVLAEQVANIPFLFSAGERGRENLITSGPLLDFYAHPHPQVNRFQYWELRVIWLMLRGESMRVPIYSQDHNSHSSHNSHSALKSVLILDPSRFQHIVEDHHLLGWRYTGPGPDSPLESQVFLPEEVWFEKLPNPFDFWRGMSPLQVAAMPAKTDFAASAFMKGIMENNADAGLIVRTEEQLDEDQRQQVIATLTNRKRRAGTADRPIFLWGVSEVVKPELSSADLQFLENRKFSRAEICAAFGVPEEALTTTDTAKYDVMAQARQNFIENRVAPLCSRLEAEENATTIPAILGSSLNHQPSNINSSVAGWFDLDSLPIMQAARRSRLVTAKTGFDMGIPLNELNRVLDLGFQPLPWGNTGYLPAKYQPLGQCAGAVSPASSERVPPPSVRT